MTAQAQIRQKINLRSVVLPAEHGAWGLLLEPLLVGFILALSTEAVILGFTISSGFLLHQPLKIAAKDRLKGRRTERTRWAERFVMIYGGTAVLLLAILLGHGSFSFLLPFVLVLPLVLLQFRYDMENNSRALIPEISGALALGTVAPAIVILAGWEYLPAFSLWLALGLRAVPAIVYVRARLRLEREKPAAISSTNLLHALAFGVSIALAFGGVFPWIVALATGFLMLRSLWGLSKYRKPASRPAVIGIREMVYGLLFSITIGIGYTL
jgi:hypothetical protein